MYSPFLQLLILKPVFGAVMAVGFTILVVVGLSLPPFWLTSPDRFAPPIRLSAVAKLRTWRLERSARAEVANGQHAEAFRIWGQALGHNPGNAQIFRGYFDAFLKAGPMGRVQSQSWYVNWARQIPAEGLTGPEDLQLPMVAEAHWFLRLTQTNRTDAETVGRVFVKLGYNHLLSRLVTPMGKDVPPDLEFALMKDTFARGDYNAFADQMRLSAGRLAGDPVFGLYRAAYEAGATRSPGAPQAKQTLLAASKDGTNRVAASRLLLWVCEREPDVAGAQAALAVLSSQGQAGIRDQVSLWRALARAGRGAEAARMVVALSEEPGTAADTVELSDLCVRVGLRDRAVALLRRSLDLHGLNPPVFIRYAALLAEEQKWFDLRDLALKVRMLESRMVAFQAFSQYLEARVAVGEGQQISARDIFARLDTVKYEDPQIGLAIAAGLLQVKMVPPAASLLTQLEKSLQTDVHYWETLARTARLQTNEVLLLRATQRRYDLDPIDPNATVEYADALLAQRSDLARALELTAQAFKTDAQNPAVRVRHAAALAANGRATEARDILDQTDESQISPADLAPCLLGKFEASLKLNQPDAAWACYDKAQAQPLFPAQRLWLATAIRSLPPRTEKNRK
jgi:thioredoxin-like negative regulator of GroEL